MFAFCGFIIEHSDCFNIYTVPHFCFFKENKGQVEINFVKINMIAVD